MNKQARNHLIALLQGLEENALSEAQAHELTALLETSQEARQLYIDYQFQSMSLDLYAHASELSPQNIAQGNWPGWMDKQSTGSAEALAELARLHEEGLKQPLDLELHNKKRAQHAHAGQAQPLRLKTKLILTGSLAACFALAGLTVLIVNLFTSPEQEIAEQLDDAIVVATLTDTKDAQWAERALARGSQLYAGDILTLTEGFAEITTHRGAIALIEAPAKIELIDSPNAMRLHAGKMVGLCETESSKGFVVQTEHATVTDIGTVFGVSVSANDATQVQVFQGEVQTSALDTDGNPLPSEAILEGQAFVIRTDALPQQALFKTKLFEEALTISRKPTHPVLTKVIRHGAIPESLASGSHEADALQMFVEHRGIALAKNVLVDVKGSTLGRATTTTDKPTIPAGVRADVYLLHYDPIDAQRPFMTGEFTVRFDRPILGVIGYYPALQASDALFRQKNKQYLVNFTNSGLERDSADQLSIAPDGKTLKLKLIAGETFVDQIRVLVQAEDAHK